MYKLLSFPDFMHESGISLNLVMLDSPCMLRKRCLIRLLYLDHIPIFLGNVIGYGSENGYEKDSVFERDWTTFS
jgi:hypothetical protein